MSKSFLWGWACLPQALPPRACTRWKLFIQTGVGWGAASQSPPTPPLQMHCEVPTWGTGASGEAFVLAGAPVVGRGLQTAPRRAGSFSVPLTQGSLSVRTCPPPSQAFFWLSLVEAVLLETVMAQWHPWHHYLLGDGDFSLSECDRSTCVPTLGRWAVSRHCH